MTRQHSSLSSSQRNCASINMLGTSKLVQHPRIEPQMRVVILCPSHSSLVELDASEVTHPRTRDEIVHEVVLESDDQETMIRGNHHSVTTSTSNHGRTTSTGNHHSLTTSTSNHCRTTSTGNHHSMTTSTGNCSTTTSIYDYKYRQYKYD